MRAWAIVTEIASPRLERDTLMMTRRVARFCFFTHYFSIFGIFYCFFA